MRWLTIRIMTEIKSQLILIQNKGNWIAIVSEIQVQARSLQTTMGKGFPMMRQHCELGTVVLLYYKTFIFIKNLPHLIGSGFLRRLCTRGGLQFTGSL